MPPQRSDRHSPAAQGPCQGLHCPHSRFVGPFPGDHRVKLRQRLSSSSDASSTGLHLQTVCPWTCCCPHLSWGHHLLRTTHSLPAAVWVFLDVRLLNSSRPFLDSVGLAAGVLNPSKPLFQDFPGPTEDTHSVHNCSWYTLEDPGGVHQPLSAPPRTCLCRTAARHLLQSRVGGGTRSSPPTGSHQPP